MSSYSGQKKKKLKPGVIFQPKTYQALQRGIDIIVSAVRPTLGPYPRITAIAPISGSKPELLDSGGTIARRIIQIPDRDADMGAMLIRHMLWTLHEKVGDGTATAAVIFQSIYQESMKYIVAGGNAMLLRTYLEEGMHKVLAHLDTMVTRVQGKEKLAHLSETICYDPALGKMLGEIFDIIGEYGRLEIRKGHSRGLEREYVEGMYWENGILSRLMANDAANMAAVMENPAILISDLDIESAEMLIPVLEQCVAAGIKSLLFIARDLNEQAMSILLNKTNREKIHTVAVKIPGMSIDAQMAALEDLSILTGGKAIRRDAGDSLNNFKVEQLGKARRVRVDQANFSIIGGKGNGKELRQHIAKLRSAFIQAKDNEGRQALQKRIGKLMGGSATLYLGGAVPSEIDANEILAERTAEAMRGAMREGVVPGGGSALIACRSVLREQLKKGGEPERQAAYNILINALAQPTFWILSNAGFTPPGAMIDRIERAGKGFGFDVKKGKVINMAEAGIMDSAATIKSAVHSAISTAALGITTDVLIHLSNPPEQFNT